MGNSNVNSLFDSLVDCVSTDEDALPETDELLLSGELDEFYGYEW